MLRVIKASEHSAQMTLPNAFSCTPPHCPSPLGFLPSSHNREMQLEGRGPGETAQTAGGNTETAGDKPKEIQGARQYFANVTKKMNMK